MRYKLLMAAAAVMLAALPATAQFYTDGSEPASVKWSFIETPTYRVIYPRGLDSLARVYATTLEQTAEPVGNGVGFSPNASYRRKMPVVLHSYMSNSNGLVTWTPRRMELYTGADAYAPEALPWKQNLILHESRHSAQMQFAAAKPFRFWHLAIGQLAEGALAGAYPGPAFFEGDAVVAETSLSKSGRGRTADFLEYYRASAAEGLNRNWYQWRWGSQRYYTPDYYTVGYLTMGGIRAYFDTPDFTKRYYERIVDKHGIAFFNLQKTTREVSGMKFKDAFDTVLANIGKEWDRDDSLRAPFIPSRMVTARQRLFTEYSGLAYTGNGLVAVRNGIAKAGELVKISPDGSVKRVGPFSSSHSSLQPSGDGSLYWSEYKSDVRWPMRTYSNIRYFDPSGVKHTLTKGERYFNPAPKDSLVAVTDYPTAGGSEIVILKAVSGEVAGRIKVPYELQAIESVWVEDKLYCSALGQEGYGIYDVSGFHAILDPVPVKITHLRSMGDEMLFTSDRTGVNELYSLNPGSGTVRQMTTLRQGGDDFRLNDAADTLYYTSLTAGGRMVYETPVSSLDIKEVDFSEIHSYELADKLSSGETLLPDYSGEVNISEAKDYSKFGHLLRFHSWAPLYISEDAISDLSFESIYQSAGLGATAFFQNDLGNFYGSVGYHADPSADAWRHSGHAKITYTGLYPVIEAGFDIGDGNSLEYTVVKDQKSGSSKLKTTSTDTPAMTASVNVYIPFNFSAGGLKIGLIPKFRASLTNDTYDGRTMSRMTASIRGYIVESIPNSRIYPRLGIGAEAGYSARPMVDDLLCPNAYGYVYGYLPGLMETHGLKLSIISQERLGDAGFCESYANIHPRGFDSYASRMLTAYPFQTKISADYAMPILPLDSSLLGPLAYIRNFELTLHGDYTFFNAGNRGGNLFSTGADLSARLGNLLWIPYDTRVGISYNYNGGSAFSSFLSAGAATGHHSISLIFSVDF